uniref:Putative secreted peptide n=1 Tax=Anopheles braziliensis TaxID=58242 RepID=A0A2M3ZVX2_9DIPT
MAFLLYLSLAAFLFPLSSQPYNQSARRARVRGPFIVICAACDGDADGCKTKPNPAFSRYNHPRGVV